MKQTLYCLPCYLNAAVNCMDRIELSVKRRYEITRELLPLLASLSEEGTPCENASKLLRTLYEKADALDPYLKEKEESNLAALELLPKLSAILDESKDRLYTALKLSAAGNIIDLAVNNTYDLLPAVEHCLNHPFSIDAYSSFKKLLHPEIKILICGDNAGEIVFDTLLVKELQALGAEVTYMVKGAPIMNDAVMADAEFCGMSRLCRCITTKRGEMGFDAKTGDAEVLNEFHSADLILSKGQANFEGLDDIKVFPAPIFFLFKLKCFAICSYTGASLGDVVFIQK